MSIEAGLREHAAAARTAARIPNAVERKRILQFLRGIAVEDNTDRSHPLQDPLGAPSDAVRVLRRIVDPRRRNDRGERRGLLAGEALRALAKVPLRPRLDPEGSTAELDDVQVQLEDPLLREVPLETPGDQDLAELAPRRACRGEV